VSGNDHEGLACSLIVAELRGRSAGVHSRPGLCHPVVTQLVIQRLADRASNDHGYVISKLNMRERQTVVLRPQSSTRVDPWL
jgi:hypothetical protein